MFLCIYENSVSLHPQNGPVAQLNRVSDYGSEGSRFEPWRGHCLLSNTYRLISVGVFLCIKISVITNYTPK